MSKHRGEKEKKDNLFFKIKRSITFHIVASLRVVFYLHVNTWNLNFCFVLFFFLEQLEINEEPSRTASSKDHDCVTAILP